MMEHELLRGSVVLAVGVLLLSTFPVPVAHATINSCSGAGCGFWWTDAVWNGRYVGNTLEFDLYVFNTSNPPLTITIASVKLVTPWGTFTDNTLPQSVCQGCEYFWYTGFTIPSTANPGTYTLNYTFTGTYQSGTAICFDKTPPNICSSSVALSVKSNPDTLQAQVTSLQQTIASLNANITSLKSQIASLQSLQASLQAQLSTAKGNITSLQASLASVNSQLSTAKANLATTQGQLAGVQATLASTQSSLSTYSNVYLPVGVAIPAVVAVLLLVLYLRKKPGPPKSYPVPPPPPG